MCSVEIQSCNKTFRVVHCQKQSSLFEQKGFAQSNLQTTFGNITVVEPKTAEINLQKVFFLPIRNVLLVSSRQNDLYNQKSKETLTFSMLSEQQLHQRKAGQFKRCIHSTACNTAVLLTDVDTWFWLTFQHGKNCTNSWMDPVPISLDQGRTPVLKKKNSNNRPRR